MNIRLNLNNITKIDLPKWWVLRLEKKIWLPLFLFMCISLLLAARPMYTAIDDQNYVAYFAHGSSEAFTDWWSYVLSEPLWLKYCDFMGNFFDSVSALRITIFLSSLMFLIACNKLTRGEWIFVLCAFIIDNTLATQMYYNQIRQGLALSVFLMFVAWDISPVLGAIVASAIHTSFISVIPCALAVTCTKRTYTVLPGILLITYYLKGVLGSIDFGKRAMYTLGGALNFKFYLNILAPYGITFYLLRNQQDKRQKFWYRFALFFVTFAFSLSLIHEAASRLIYFTNAFVLILIGLDIKSKKAKICAVIWFLILLEAIVLEGYKTGFDSNSWYGRWELILNGT